MIDILEKKTKKSILFRVKEVLPKEEPTPEIVEVTETGKKSRLDNDDDDANTLADDGQIWSKPLAEVRESNREDEFDEYLQTLFF